MFTSSSTAHHGEGLPERDFRSVYFPRSQESQKGFRLYWMQTFFGGVVVVMFFAVFRVALGEDVLWLGLGGVAAALVLAWPLAIIRMQSRPAMIHFAGNSFFYYTVYDIVYHAGKLEPFPCSYANPARDRKGLNIHYHDRVVLMKPEHWPELDEIHQAFYRHAAVE